jgi:glycine cleavage system H protein
MNNPSGHSEHSVVPPNEQRCVWMTAGILSYQLCDRGFDCDNCPLDAAMRKHYQAGRSSAVHAEQKSSGLTDLRNDYSYSLGHCWIRRRSESLVRVGIEPGLARALMAPKAVAFPSVGERVAKDQICLWIITEGGTFPVSSPLTGKVWAVNSLLTEKPHKLEQHPYDQGWLFDLSVEGSVDEMEALLNDGQAAERFNRDDERLKELLHQALFKERPAVGPTLADGGEMLRQVADILGPRKYFSILSSVFC